MNRAIWKHAAFGVFMLILAAFVALPIGVAAAPASDLEREAEGFEGACNNGGGWSWSEHQNFEDGTEAVITVTCFGGAWNGWQCQFFFDFDVICTHPRTAETAPPALPTTGVNAPVVSEPAAGTPVFPTGEQTEGSKPERPVATTTPADPADDEHKP